MLIVGERINTSRHAINEAVAGRDAVAIQREVRLQVDGGADLIDVNAGSRRDSEVDDLIWLIEEIQNEFPKVRLSIDSANPDSMNRVLDRVMLRPMLNSTTGERSRMEAMAPVIQKRACDIVALCMDDRGIPKTAGQTVENTVRLVSDLEDLGVPRDRIFLDPVTQAVSANTRAGMMALEAIDGIRRELDGVHIISGLSNISFGLPRRPLVNRAFLTLAMKAGLTAAILDPSDRGLMSALKAAQVLLDQDPWCQAYTRAFREGRLEA
ncbi:MAG: Methyltetrahydrofolate cobalamin methyltransferase [Thermodesulfobacteriota bacterium]|nr:Methyltetrahydrofolate cobalamin methyltransferase [Thermodesulfobacteriota bacterium]